MDEKTVMGKIHGRYADLPILKSKSSTTAETTLSELRNYQMMKKRDGTYMPVYALSKKQKELFACFDLDQQLLRKMLNQVTPASRT